MKITIYDGGAMGEIYHSMKDGETLQDALARAKENGLGREA